MELLVVQHLPWCPSGMQMPQGETKGTNKWLGEGKPEQEDQPASHSGSRLWLALALPALPYTPRPAGATSRDLVPGAQSDLQ